MKEILSNPVFPKCSNDFQSAANCVFLKRIDPYHHSEMYEEYGGSNFTKVLYNYHMTQFAEDWLQDFMNNNFDEWLKNVKLEVTKLEESISFDVTGHWE